MKDPYDNNYWSREGYWWDINFDDELYYLKCRKYRINFIKYLINNGISDNKL